eukprot:6182770-Pleurochrysis_carterae.AAC.2
MMILQYGRPFRRIVDSPLIFGPNICITKIPTCLVASQPRDPYACITHAYKKMTSRPCDGDRTAATKSCAIRYEASSADADT